MHNTISVTINNWSIPTRTFTTADALYAARGAARDDAILMVARMIIGGRDDARVEITTTGAYSDVVDIINARDQHVRAMVSHLQTRAHPGTVGNR